MKDAKKLFSARNVAYLGILVALTLVMQIWGGMISIGPVQLNFSLIPIVLGAVLLGPVAGGILGFVCGAVITVQVIMGLAPFYVIIWEYSPVVAVLTCILKTTVAGFVSGLVYRVIAKKNTLVAMFVASGIVPVLNTGLFILGCLCMSNAISVFQSGIAEMAGMDIMMFILVGLVTYNFFLEFAINLLVAPALSTVVRIVEKNVLKKRVTEAVLNDEEEAEEAKEESAQVAEKLQE